MAQRLTITVFIEVHAMYIFTLIEPDSGKIPLTTTTQ